MAKKTKGEEKLSIAEVLKNLNKKYSNSESVERFIIPTGSIALDKAIGGGYVSGRITEFIAWEGVGKTTAALHAVKETQEMGKIAAYIDAEHALDKKYAEAIGVNWEKLILIQPSFGEEAFEYAEQLIKSGEIGLIVFDSTSGMIPKSQFESDPGNFHVGKHALLFAKEVPKLNTLLSNNNVACIFISQVREKIGVMFGSPEITPAGNTLKFFASNRIELRKFLKKEGDKIVGTDSKFKVIKCKTNNPYSIGILPIRFGIGINKYEEILTLAKDCEVIKVWGEIVTVFNEPEEPLKIKIEEFLTLLKDNEEFFNDIKNKINVKYTLEQEIE